MQGLLFKATCPILGTRHFATGCESIEDFMPFVKHYIMREMLNALDATATSGQNALFFVMGSEFSKLSFNVVDSAEEGTDGRRFSHVVEMSNKQVDAWRAPELYVQELERNRNKLKRRTREMRERLEAEEYGVTLEELRRRKALKLIELRDAARRKADRQAERNDFELEYPVGATFYKLDVCSPSWSRSYTFPGEAYSIYEGRVAVDAWTIKGHRHGRFYSYVATDKGEVVDHQMRGWTAERPTAEWIESIKAAHKAEYDALVAKDKAAKAARSERAAIAEAERKRLEEERKVELERLEAEAKAAGFESLKAKQEADKKAAAKARRAEIQAAAKAAGFKNRTEQLKAEREAAHKAYLEGKAKERAARLAKANEATHEPMALETTGQRAAFRKAFDWAKQVGHARVTEAVAEGRVASAIGWNSGRRGVDSGEALAMLHGLREGIQ